MRLKVYFAPLLKWWWLIVLSTCLAGGVSYLIVRAQPPIYRASTTLVIGRAIYELNPTGIDLDLPRRLADAYAAIAMREPVRESARIALGLDILPENSAVALPNSPFVEIQVIDTDPQRAMIVANELGNQLILQSPSGLQGSDQERQAFINQQLDDLQTDIKNTKDEITQKEEEILRLTSAAQIAQVQDEINALNERLTLLQTNYGTLLSNTQSGASNTITVLEPASIPTRPIGPNKLLITLLASFAGFSLAVGTSYLVEFWDRSIRTDDDVQRVLKLPVIGHVAEYEKTEGPYILKYPLSPVAESFRTIRTNLEFAGVDQPLKTILVTSIGIGDGKTSLATNLAFSISQTEKKTLLMDADLRKPSIHEVLNYYDQPGLVEMFRYRFNVMDVLRSYQGQKCNVITAGSTPPNPAELLGSKRMDQILKEVSEYFDVVIIDGPPLIVTDSVVISSKVDGVIFVLTEGRTSEDVARKSLEQLNRAGVKVVGVVLNRSHQREAGYYGYGNYYTSKETSKASAQKVSARGDKGSSTIKSPAKVEKN